MNVFELIKEKLENATYWTKSTFDEDGYCNDDSEEVLDINMALDIVDEVAQEYNNGWIPCSERLPEAPKENPLFDYKPLELYLVTVRCANGDIDATYPFRAFWNGTNFTDGWKVLNVAAWQPLPAPYEEGGMEYGQSIKMR